MYKFEQVSGRHQQMSLVRWATGSLYRVESLSGEVQWIMSNGHMGHPPPMDRHD